LNVQSTSETLVRLLLSLFLLKPYSDIVPLEEYHQPFALPRSRARENDKPQTVALESLAGCGKSRLVMSFWVLM